MISPATSATSSSSSLADDYLRLLRKKNLFGLTLLALLICAAGFSLHTGSLALPWSEILRALGDWETTGRTAHVIHQIRLPRTVAAILAGGSLGIAGAVMQNVLKNPLASPFTIGVSQGAAFGAAFAIIFLGAGQTHSSASTAVTIDLPNLVVLCAFAGALLAVIFILILASLKGVSTEAVILAGVALSAFFGAATMLLQYFADDVQVAASVFWTFGDLGKAGWTENILIGITAVVAFIFFLIGRWEQNALLWGDEVAASLGIRVRHLRITAMLFSALAVAVTTAFLGIIGFIGLMAPHLARLFVGNDYRYLLISSALTGALLLLVSDIISRILIPPVILPVGIITSFAGAPLFLYLLTRRRKN